jgi:DNA-directed RNA polymerase specialized sigma24 family protein
MLDSANLTRSEGRLVQPYTEALFRGFIADYGLALRHFILKKVGNEADAAEPAQQTLAEARSNLRGYRGEASFSTCIFGIASNIALNHVNRTARRRWRLETFDEHETTLRCRHPDSCEALTSRQARSSPVIPSSRRRTALAQAPVNTP